MSLSNRLVASVLRILLGYAAASFAGAMSLVVLTLIATAAKSDPEPPTLSLGVVFSAPFVALFVGWFALVPGAIAVAFAEIFVLQRWWFHALAGIGAATWFLGLAASDGGGFSGLVAIVLILATGLISGLAYWAVAGRRSGAWKSVTSSG